MPTPSGASLARIAFVSSNSSWGGSEELWSATAEVLALDGHAVAICKNNLDVDEPRLHRLRALHCPCLDLGELPGLTRRITARVIHHALPSARLSHVRLDRFLRRHRPHLIVLSQGGNHDGVRLADWCRQSGVPYVLIAQKADDIYWPPDDIRPRMRTVYTQAHAAFFVSEHNRILTEEQIGVSLPRAEVVRNPYLVARDDMPAWPEQPAIRLACVGRLDAREKGQDLILRVLSRPAWRTRPLSVTFFGQGHNAEGLAGMARHLELSSVAFRGFVRDVPAIWRDHHGLVLPSRCEGLPLAAVETMMSGRVPIVTAIGGSPEIIEDNHTGFLAAAPTEAALDEAMTRAWNRRDEWQAIGTEAARRIRTLIPPSPERVLADRLLDLCRHTAGHRSP